MSNPDFSELFAKAGEEPDSEFNLYECWDVEEREDWMIQQARKDGFELSRGPHLFQSGAMYSTKFIVAAQASNRIGKSYDRLIEVIMMGTGLIPVALRTKGVDTGVKRHMGDSIVRSNNILRWGRRDVETGEVIDHCPWIDGSGQPTDDKRLMVKDMPVDGTWDCGTVIGTGIYPLAKIPQDPTLIRVCSWKQAKDDYWWPTLKAMWPKSHLRLDKGTDGFAEQEQKIYTSTGTIVSVITYESGYTSQEAAEVWMTVFDEEPKDRRIFTGALPRSRYIRFSFTAINGISWSKKDIIDSRKKNIEVFHACQYDCPFKTRHQVDTIAGPMRTWERVVKVWGGYSEQVGQPFYNRDKLNEWIGRIHPIGELAEFKPESPWTDPKEAMDIIINLDKHIEEEGQATWTIFEDVMPDAAYYMGIDTADGHDNPDEVNAADYGSAVIRRKTEDLYDPIVAAIKTMMPSDYFWRICVEASAYYNGALMGPEGTGDNGSVFVSRIETYPHVMHMTVISQATRKPVDKPGFSTRSNTRSELFHFVKEDIDTYEHNPGIHFESILQEASEAVRGKNGRCDHPAGKHNDSLVAYGISCWMKAKIPDQIRFHRNGADREKSRPGAFSRVRNRESEETRPLIGSTKGLDARLSNVRKRY